MAAAVICRACGAQPRDEARFCDACGARIEAPTAEYKQVTVLFADVVHSMDLASTLDAERLREIMADLFDRSASIVRHYGGTVDKFTGDGIMAVFGAPISLEDHAFRACLAALDIQRNVGVTLQLRIGLNSGQVIAGEIGSTTGNYTAIGEVVGMAQRMESVAPPGGVILSESTARLVENVAVLGSPEQVHIKNIVEPVAARRLVAIGDHQPPRRTESPLVGRTWELATVSGIFDEAISGAGCVVTVVGPPGIGKSRLIRETTAAAVARGVPVYSTYCESHATDVPFHVAARLLRSALDVANLTAEAARRQVHKRFLDADPEDLVLLDDLLGIRAPSEHLPEVAPDARRRRLTALINSASLTNPEPAVYVIEDVHWIDEASESLLSDFLAVVPQIPALTLLTHRPEYRGRMSQIPGAQRVALRPLSDAQTAMLAGQLVGADPALGNLAVRVAERARGNPFFAEEMVRDLAERGVLNGQPGSYALRGDVDDAEVPATLYATIGARIDRLGHAAKQTLNAAAVIGSRFDDDLLAALVEDADVTPLIAAELVDQVGFRPDPKYAFRNPLIRAVAFESQLKSDRSQLHTRLATVLEAQGSADENAALIAEHLEAAGDLHAAYEWHMRAGTWSNFRDDAAAMTSWRRARRVADLLPEADPDRTTMRIAPRTLLCATVTRTLGSGAETGFEELRDLCIAAGDQRSLAIATAGHALDQYFNSRLAEASRTGSELVQLLESIGDPTLTLALLSVPLSAKQQTGEMSEVLRLAERGIELAGGDSTKGKMMTGSPLTLIVAMRGMARTCLGIAGWRDDFQRAVSMGRTAEPVTRSAAMYFTYIAAIANRLLAPTVAVLREAEAALEIAEQSGGDVAVGQGKQYLGILLVRLGGSSRARGFQLLDQVRTMALEQRYNAAVVTLIDILLAEEKIRIGDIAGAISLSRPAVNEFFGAGDVLWAGYGTNVLVEALLLRKSPADLQDAKVAVDRLAAAQVEAGFVLHTVWLLRAQALLAQAQGGEGTYRELRDHYRKMATELGFEGHMAMAEAMP
ncbi:ATP-binding protein [Mycolicibacterium gadium]|uniref:Cyclase n=1 Tax=Mycolicibacterium gadium TaxID=1794 RepID=A0A7I7WYU9_MYCGU|nr:adenylate/guanylate cyclase domain-containing protein [Mycolicibacterium gadium]BBZ21118.1 cyclase [Mycolicibacterium gadium]